MEQTANIKTAMDTIEYLWDILDDIDTIGDIFKGNDVAYRKRVEELQKRRWATGITTDGYTLDFSNMKSTTKRN